MENIHQTVDVCYVSVNYGALVMSDGPISTFPVSPFTFPSNAAYIV